MLFFLFLITKISYHLGIEMLYLRKCKASILGFVPRKQDNKIGDFMVVLFSTEFLN